jgi:hypothetical protein
MKRSLLVCALALPLLLGVTCGSGPVSRGEVSPSGNGKTYLVVDDDNGGGCGPVLVDGTPWGHALHTPGEISPGTHIIESCASLSFEVAAGTTFRFNYWGP